MLSRLKLQTAQKLMTAQRLSRKPLHVSTSTSLIPLRCAQFISTGGSISDKTAPKSLNQARKMATATEHVTAIVSREVGGRSKMENIKVGPPHADEVLVDIHAAGICHTDIAIMSGSMPGNAMPSVFGHEGAGVVLETGENVKGIAKGDKVLLSFAHCGDCDQCSGGHPAYCNEFIPRNFSCLRPHGGTGLQAEDGSEMYGSFFGQSSFASKSLVHKNSIVKVPQDTPLELFAPIGCGQITGAGTVFNVLDLQPKDSLLVFGCGGVGLAVIMAANIRKAKQIIAVDLFESRLSLAKELGATHVFKGEIAKDSDKLIEEIKKLCPPNGVSYAIDTTGVVTVIQTMLDCVGTRGKGISLGAPPVSQSTQISPAMHLLAGKSYIGVTEGDSIPGQIIPYLIEEYKKGNYPIDKLIKYYPAKDFQQAFDDMHKGITIKPVLLWKG